MVESSYDYECDVVIVGYGCAGAAAAIEAAASGADVILLERGSGAGGSSAMSGGEIYLGGGTATQLACGYEDTADDMYNFLVTALGPNADEIKLRAYCDGSVEHHDWLVECGVPFKPSLWDTPTWMPSTEDGLMWMGERGWPFHEVARPAPRGHRPPTGHFAGWLLMEKLVAAANEAGAVAHFDTVAKELIKEGDAVIGLRARHFGETVSYRARRGVILTTGGFVDNEEMLEQHAPQLRGHGKVSDGYDDGSGIRLGQTIGAATRRMSAGQISMTIVPALTARGIIVNRHGQRFVNEDIYPGLISEAAFHQPSPVWVIVDETGFEETPLDDRGNTTPTYAAETIEELENELGMPAGTLSATVETYNRYAEVGEDPLFHKTATWLRPLRGPFAALDPSKAAGSDEFPATGESTGFLMFTLGGLDTTVDGEVKDLDGRVIPGLFAAGRVSTGIHGKRYISGTSLGDGTFFGRRAGRTAARRTAVAAG